MKSTLERLAPIWVPHAGQDAFLRSKSAIKVLACGRRWGKTDACAVMTLNALLQDRPSRHLLLAPTQDQAAILFDRVIQLLHGLEITDFKIRKSPFPKLEFGGHVVQARSGHVGRFLRGNEATHVIVDEAAFVPEELVTEVAMPMLATTSGSLTLISTPNGHNHFYRFFRMGEEGANGVWSRSAPTSENPLVRPEFLQVQRELLSERAFAVEYEARFADSVGRVFASEAIDACTCSALPERSGPICIGVDWARYTDYTAVAVVQGHRNQCNLLECAGWTALSWNQQVERVAEIAEKYPAAPLLCDATGVGDPVNEMLRDRLGGRLVNGFVFTQASKSELIQGLALMIERHSVSMTPHPFLIKELSHYEATLTNVGNVRLGAASGYHDDLVTALALATHQLPTEYRPVIQLGSERKFTTTQYGGDHVQYF